MTSSGSCPISPATPPTMIRKASDQVRPLAGRASVPHAGDRMPPGCPVHPPHPERFTDARLRALQRRVMGWRDVMARKPVLAASGESPLSGQPARPGQPRGSSDRIRLGHIEEGLLPHAWEDGPVARSSNAVRPVQGCPAAIIRDSRETSPESDQRSTLGKRECRRQRPAAFCVGGLSWGYAANILFTGANLTR